MSTAARLESGLDRPVIDTAQAPDSLPAQGPEVRGRAGVATPAAARDQYERAGGGGSPAASDHSSGLRDPHPASSSAAVEAARLAVELAPAPLEGHDLMAATLRYFFADLGLDHQALVGAIAARGGVLRQADLRGLGVEYERSAAGQAGEAESFTIEDAEAWARTPAGQAYLPAYGHQLAAGQAAPAPLLANDQGPIPLGPRELVLIGRHELEGALAGQPYRVTLEIGPDASARLARHLPGGATEHLAGRARLETRDLLLELDDGQVLRYVRPSGERDEFLLQAGDRVERLVPTAQQQGRLAQGLELLTSAGSFNYLFNRNLGVVDDDPAGDLLRSRQPTPNFVAGTLARRGVKTIVSLNGLQDKTMWYNPPREPFAEQDPPAQRVVLGDFIAQRGLEHHTFGLSAGRAPSDEELVGIFRLLLDPSKRPLLFHCTGGADRTGVIAALFAIEFQGASKELAKELMRRHMWRAVEGADVQGAYVDLYQRGTLTRLLTAHGVQIPERYRAR